ncbi:MlaD family protein [Alkaliflexus imshenetskii]|uniref:MlaD family protein n=1 Tax=Alkaliflexus imshenetskii TaxID=286730 RepID=UPI00047D2586|nr:MlaD family protein [Alkaliflexus imshenetskii]
MESHTQKFKVRLGLFIIGGLAIFVTAIFLIGRQQNLFDPVFKVTTTFNNISGLRVGSNIRYSGIDVGIVDNISIINDSTVKVNLLIKRSVQQFIKADCEAGIGSSGIIGDRILIITQGSSDAPVVADGQEIKSVEPVETDDIIKSLKVTADNVSLITFELAEIMININSGNGTLGRLIKDSTTAESISQVIRNLEESSQGLNATILATRADVSNIMQSVLVSTENAERITLRFDQIVEKINQGDGPIGRLIQDTIMSENINQTIINVKESTHALNENLEALKHNFLFRGYFKRKAKEEEKNKQATEEYIRPE